MQARAIAQKSLIILPLLGIAAAMWVDAVIDFGFRLPMHDLAIDYGVGMLVWAALAFTIPLVSQREDLRNVLLVGWGLKGLVALLVMPVYENLYPLDAIGYFSAGLSGAPAIADTDLGAGAVLIRGMSKGIQTLIGPSYHGVKVVFGFLGFLGAWCFYRAFAIVIRRDSTRVLAVAMCTPTVLFWSSILGKDPIVFFGLGLHTLGVAQLLRIGERRAWITIVAGAALAGIVRPWLLGILIVPLLAVWVLRRPVTRGFLVVIGAGLVVPRALRRIQSFTGVPITRDLLFEGLNRIEGSWAIGGSAQASGITYSSVADVARFLPRGGFAALFRPLPWERLDPFSVIAGIEGLAFLCIVAFGVSRTRRAQVADPALQWTWLLVAAWTAVYAFISYQNLGTAVRCRLQIFLPLLAIGFLPLLLPSAASSPPVPPSDA